MTDDATLSDFAGPSEDGTETDDELEEPNEDQNSARELEEPNEDRDQTDGLEEASEAELDGDEANEGEPNEGEPGVTYAWGEYTCTRCEQETDRVWRDEDDAVVCPSCKAW